MFLLFVGNKKPCAYFGFLSGSQRLYPRFVSFGGSASFVPRALFYLVEDVISCQQGDLPSCETSVYVNILKCVCKSSYDKGDVFWGISSMEVFFQIVVIVESKLYSNALGTNKTRSFIQLELGRQTDL